MVTFELARLRGWTPPPGIEEHTPLAYSVATPWEAYRERALEDSDPTAELIAATVAPEDAAEDKRLAPRRRAELAAAVYADARSRQAALRRGEAP